MHARFHMWRVCGRAWWHLCHPLATRAGRRNRAWGRKSQSKSRLGRFHDTPSVPLAYIQLPQQPLPRNQVALCICLLYIWLLRAAATKREFSGSNKEWAVVWQKAEIFLRRDITEWALVGRSNCCRGERSQSDKFFFLFWSDRNWINSIMFNILQDLILLWSDQNWQEG